MRSVQSNDGYPIDEFEASSHTKSRSPQLNDDNMSSSQVADASATHRSSSSINSDFPFAFDLGQPPTDTNNNHPTYHPATTHAPPSNNDSSSTETPGTDDTPTQDHTYGPYPNPYTPYFPHAPYYDNPDHDPHAYDPTYPQLTSTHLALHQRELAGLYTTSLPGWVAGAGAGVGTRRRVFDEPPLRSDSMGSSVLTAAGTRHSLGSVDGSTIVAGVEGLAMMGGGGGVAAIGDEVVAAAGAWAVEEAVPVVVVGRRGRPVSVLSLGSNESYGSYGSYGAAAGEEEEGWY